MSNRTLIVIPARLESSRLPRKLLLTAGGKTILEHTYLAAKQSKIADDVVIAVDHPDLAAAADSFGANWQMTSPDCASGTDRIAEVARDRVDANVLINVQGDEPEIDPEIIDMVGQTLIDSPTADIATAGTPLRDVDQLSDPNCVKIQMGDQQRAITFSRSAIPHAREGITPELLQSEPPIFWQHIGLYAYRNEFLNWFAKQRESTLEKVEKLEQLRAIEAGRTIVAARVNHSAPGIDTQADYEAFVRRIAHHSN